MREPMRQLLQVSGVIERGPPPPVRLKWRPERAFIAVEIDALEEHVIGRKACALLGPAQIDDGTHTVITK